MVNSLRVLPARSARTKASFLIVTVNLRGLFFRVITFWSVKRVLLASRFARLQAFIVMVVVVALGSIAQLRFANKLYICFG